MEAVSTRLFVASSKVDTQWEKDQSIGKLAFKAFEKLIQGLKEI